MEIEIDNKELFCECGHPDDQHIHNFAECVVPECGCKAFEIRDDDDEDTYDPDQ